MTEQPENAVTAPLTPMAPVKTEIAIMDFPEAMRMVKDGKQVARLEWSPDNKTDYGFLKDEWLTIFRQGQFHVWKVSAGDMESIDWIIVSESN